MSRKVPLNEGAVEVFTRMFEPGSKVMILGGTGWFGRTTLAMLKHVNLSTLIIASKTREFEVDGQSYSAVRWNQDDVERFEADTVLDFACQTVNKARLVGYDLFVQTNKELARRLSFAANLSSTRRVLSVSSGASVRLPLEMRDQSAAKSYSLTKQALEAQLAEIASSRNVSVGVARAWSVSGGHVQNPRGYAFSGMILDSLESGVVSVRADHLVYRRYSAVEDLLALAVPRSEDSGYSVIDSGGELIEIRDLARMICEEIPGSHLMANQSKEDPLVADRYFAGEQDWNHEKAKRGLETLALRKQIHNVTTSLIST